MKEDKETELEGKQKRVKMGRNKEVMSPSCSLGLPTEAWMNYLT